MPVSYTHLGDQLKKTCVEMLTFFRSIEFDSYIYKEIMYYLQSGIFRLLFEVIKNIDDPDKLETLYLIDLLQRTHEHLLGDRNELLVSRNMKWVTGMIFFTFYLKLIIAYFVSKNPELVKTYNFNIKTYEDLLVLLLDVSGDIRDEVTKSLKELTDKKEILEESNTNEGVFVPATPEMIKELQSFTSPNPVESDVERNRSYGYLDHIVFFYDRDFRFLNLFRDNNWDSSMIV